MTARLLLPAPAIAGLLCAPPLAEMPVPVLVARPPLCAVGKRIRIAHPAGGLRSTVYATVTRSYPFTPREAGGRFGRPTRLYEVTIQQQEWLLTEDELTPVSRKQPLRFTRPIDDFRLAS